MVRTSSKSVSGSADLTYTGRALRVRGSRRRSAWTDSEPCVSCEKIRCCSSFISNPAQIQCLVLQGLMALNFIYILCAPGNRSCPLTHERGYRSAQDCVHGAMVLRTMPLEFFRE